VNIINLILQHSWQNRVKLLKVALIALLFYIANFLVNCHVTVSRVQWSLVVRELQSGVDKQYAHVVWTLSSHQLCHPRQSVHAGQLAHCCLCTACVMTCRLIHYENSI